MIRLPLLLSVFSLAIAGCANRGADDRTPISEMERADNHGAGYAVVTYRQTDRARYTNGVVVSNPSGIEPVAVVNVPLYTMDPKIMAAKAEESDKLLAKLDVLAAKIDAMTIEQQHANKTASLRSSSSDTAATDAVLKGTGHEAVPESHTPPAREVAPAAAAEGGMEPERAPASTVAEPLATPPPAHEPIPAADVEATGAAPQTAAAPAAADLVDTPPAPASAAPPVAAEAPQVSPAASVPPVVESVPPAPVEATEPAAAPAADPMKSTPTRIGGKYLSGRNP